MLLLSSIFKPRPTPRSPSRLAYALLLFIIYLKFELFAAWMWTKICSFDFFFFLFPWVFLLLLLKETIPRMLPYGPVKAEGYSHPNYLKTSIKGAVEFFFFFLDVVVRISDPDGNTRWMQKSRAFLWDDLPEKNELEIFILSFEWKFLCRVSVAVDVLHFQTRPSLCRYLNRIWNDGLVCLCGLSLAQVFSIIVRVFKVNWTGLLELRTFLRSSEKILPGAF